MEDDIIQWNIFEGWWIWLYTVEYDEYTMQDDESIIEDDNLSISRGGILPLGEYRDMWVFKKIEAILKSKGLDISTPIKNIPDDVLEIILFGNNIEVAVESTKYPATLWHTTYNGVVGFIKKTLKFRSGKTKDFMDDCNSGGDKMNEYRRNSSEHSIEAVGENLRSMMPWISANKIVDKAKN